MSFVNKFYKVYSRVARYVPAGRNGEKGVTQRRYDKLSQQARECSSAKWKRCEIEISQPWKGSDGMMTIGQGGKKRGTKEMLIS